MPFRIEHLSCLPCYDPDCTSARLTFTCLQDAVSLDTLLPRRWRAFRKSVISAFLREPGCSAHTRASRFDSPPKKVEKQDPRAFYQFLSNFVILIIRLIRVSSLAITRSSLPTAIALLHSRTLSLLILPIVTESPGFPIIRIVL